MKKKILVTLATILALSGTGVAAAHPWEGDQPTKICVIVDPISNKAVWMIQNEDGPETSGRAKYEDVGSRLVWSKTGVPLLVKQVAREETGRKLRHVCLSA